MEGSSRRFVEEKRCLIKTNVRDWGVRRGGQTGFTPTNRSGVLWNESSVVKGTFLIMTKGHQISNFTLRHRKFRRFHERGRLNSNSGEDQIKLTKVPNTLHLGDTKTVLEKKKECQKERKGWLRNFRDGKMGSPFKERRFEDVVDTTYQMVR